MLELAVVATLEAHQAATRTLLPPPVTPLTTASDLVRQRSTL